MIVNNISECVSPAVESAHNTPCKSEYDKNRIVAVCRVAQKAVRINRTEDASMADCGHANLSTERELSIYRQFPLKSKTD